MKLKILGSSSAGNCYILENETEALVIEAGVRFDDFKAAMNFNLTKIVAVLITHEHGDHACYAKNFAAAGIPVLSSRGTLDAIKVKQSSDYALQAEKTVKIRGNFSVMPFGVIHDAAEPFGFLISHPETGRVLFATDTADLEYSFAGLNNILIEANFSEAIMEENIYAGRLNVKHQNRVINSHLSLEKCDRILSENNLEEVNNIVLLHLSSGNSNAHEFKRFIEMSHCKFVTIADEGIEINLNKTRF